MKLPLVLVLGIVCSSSLTVMGLLSYSQTRITDVSSPITSFWRTTTEENHYTRTFAKITRFLQKAGLIPGVPDDIHHCNHRQDDKWNDDDTVVCDEDDRRWVVNDLDPKKAPKRCKNFDYNDYDPDEDDEWNSYYEPCLLWEMNFGDLKASAVPTQVPPTSMPSTTRMPTIAPTSSPSTTLAPTTTPTGGPTVTSFPTLAPSVNLASNLRVDITPFELRLVVPSTTSTRRRLLSSSTTRSGVRRRQSTALDTSSLTPTTLIEVDRDEWLELTTQHVFQHVELSSLSSFRLDFDPAPTRYYLDKNQGGAVWILQQVQGVAYYDSDDGTQELTDTAVQSSFQDTAMFEYLLLLQDAQDPVLANTQKVSIDTTESSSGGSSDDGFVDSVTNYFSDMDTSDILLVSSVGVAVVGFVLVAFFWCKIRRARHLQKQQDLFLNTSNIDEHDGLEIPKVPTAETEDISPRSSYGSKRAPPQSAPFDDRDGNERPHGDDDDDASVATSTYSYFEEESSVMSSSLMNHPYGGTRAIDSYLGDAGSVLFDNSALDAAFKSRDDGDFRDLSVISTLSEDNTSVMYNGSSGDAGSVYPADANDRGGGVRELFGPGVVTLGDAKELPAPPRALMAAQLAEGEDEDEDTEQSSSYDGHMALSKYYEDRSLMTDSVGEANGDVSSLGETRDEKVVEGGDSKKKDQ